MSTWLLAAFATATASAIVLAWSVVEIVRGTLSESWPHAIGTVLDSSVQKSAVGHSISYRPSVIYSYRVGGSEYCGYRFQFGQSFLTGGSATWAENQIRGLAEGSTVDVYYKLRRPSVSTLRQRVTWRVYLAAAIAALIVTEFLRELVAGRFAVGG